MRSILVAMLAVGCNKPAAGPPCDKVVDHLLEVTKQGLTGHGGAELGNRQQLIDTCIARKTPAYDACALKANDLNGLAACTKLLPKPATPR